METVIDTTTVLKKRGRPAKNKLEYQPKHPKPVPQAIFEQKEDPTIQSDITEPDQQIPQIPDAENVKIDVELQQEMVAEAISQLEDKAEDLKELIETLKQSVEVEQKKQVILSIDPGFVKMGIAILGLIDKTVIETFALRLRPVDKQKQAHLDGYISNNIKRVLNQLSEKYDIKYVVIELQLGQFACSSIQLAIVCCLNQSVLYTIQHSKLKLKFKELQPAKNSESKQYNQNKHQGRDLCKILYPDLPELSFDECDAILHGRYALDNVETIDWIKKEDLV